MRLIDVLIAMQRINSDAVFMEVWLHVSMLRWSQEYELVDSWCWLEKHWEEL